MSDANQNGGSPAVQSLRGPGIELSCEAMPRWHCEAAPDLVAEPHQAGASRIPVASAVQSTSERANRTQRVLFQLSLGAAAMQVVPGWTAREGFAWSGTIAPNAYCLRKW